MFKKCSSVLAQFFRGRPGITRNARGSSLIEFAIVLPLFLLLMCAIVEFGWYFVRYDGLSRGLSVTAADLQINGGPASTTQTVANGNGSGIIAFGTGNNYICAQVYQNNPNPTYTAAGYCQTGTWFTSGTCIDTNATCNEPYYIGIVAHADSMPLTGLVNTILPKGTAITQSIAVEVGAASSGGGSSYGAFNVPAATLTNVPANTCATAIRIDMTMDLERDDNGPNNNGNWGWFEMYDGSASAANSIGKVVFGMTKNGGAGYGRATWLSGLTRTVYITSVTVAHAFSGAYGIDAQDGDNYTNSVTTSYHSQDSKYKMPENTQNYAPFYSVTCVN